MTTPYTRLAREADLPRIRQIECEAEQRFVAAGIGFGPLSDPAVIPDFYRTACRGGALLVAVDKDDRPLGFAALDVVDGVGHIAELDVEPARHGQGIGTMLIEAACGWAVGRGYPAISLTTFREVRWNGPYYTSRRFVELAPNERGPGLQAILDDEARRGLERRCAMRRQL